MTNRKHFGSLNGLHSKARNASCGMPQGYCSGPLPFIVNLNDIEECLESSWASIYTDGTSLTIAQHEVLNISEWMAMNKLSPNPKNTTLMVIGHPLKTRKLTFEEF